MPTPGPWQDAMPLTIPGTITQSGRYRWGLDATDAYHPGVMDAEDIDSVVNARRLNTNAGETGSGGWAEFGSRCGVDVYYDEDIGGVEGTFVDRGEALDTGWFLAANLVNGWGTYTSAVSAIAFGAGASGYEIEGGNLLHIVSVDGVNASIPLLLSGTDAPMLTMDVRFYTAPAEDYTTSPTAATLRDARSLSTSYPVHSDGGTEAQPPLVLDLSPPDFDPTDGGLHVYPISSQEPSGPWATGGYAGRGQILSQIILYTEGTVTLTYDVTFPRYRLLFDEAIPPTIVEERVTRLYPRDDALGLGSAPRLYPPPRGGRVVGGHT